MKIITSSNIELMHHMQNIDSPAGYGKGEGDRSCDRSILPPSTNNGNKEGRPIPAGNLGPLFLPSLCTNQKETTMAYNAYVQHITHLIEPRLPHTKKATDGRDDYGFMLAHK